jgi:hypothetical protein
MKHCISLVILIVAGCSGEHGQHPAPCNCVQQPTVAEDDRARSDGTIAVRCTQGLCNTFVP